jgi:KipI family sensor histidine kinase inhibitor
MRVLPYGSHAALVDLDSADEVFGLNLELAEDPLPGMVELVPAARTLLVRYDTSTGFDRISAALAERSATVRPRTSGAEVVVPVRYDGADLADVARETGLSKQDVVRLHTSTTYAVAFCGFAPGFGYLTGLDPRLHLARRSTPRTKVPAGSVAIAGEYSAVYPRESPGGWHLLGRTDLVVWDIDRDPPQLLVPGTRIRFVETLA